jgi:hypothetical protein
VKAGWLDVTSPPDSEGWQWGEVPPDYYEVWRELGGSPILSVALKIRLDLDDIARNMALFPDRSHELWYEDLISSPEATLRAICEFADLDWTPGFAQVVRAMSFYDSTRRWTRHLTEEQGNVVLEFLKRTEASPSLRRAFLQGRPRVRPPDEWGSRPSVATTCPCTLHDSGYPLAVAGCRPGMREPGVGDSVVARGEVPRGLLDAPVGVIGAPLARMDAVVAHHASGG